MGQKKKILALSGSTRANSSSLQIIHFISEMTEKDLEITIYNGLTDLPFFNQDLDKDKVPETVLNFRKAIENADGVIICTPEYVFSVPGVLKNAIEWIVSTVVFSDKPTAVITASSSGIKGHESLILIMKTVGAKLNDDSALLIQGVQSKLTKDGKINNESTLSELNKLIAAFKRSLN
jgi:chromate reductase